MKNDEEELKGVLMAMQDQTNEKACLEILRRYKAQILKENPLARIDENILIDFAIACKYYAYEKYKAHKDFNCQERFLSYYYKIQAELSRRRKKED
ncbi:MAG: hypothetical protein ACOC5T_07725 [Elusimicrobiota bacterium]